MRQDATVRRRHARRLAPPRDAADVSVVPVEGRPAALDAQDVLRLLRAAVTLYPDPSPRTPMAFAATRDWVLKANLRRRSRERERVFRDAAEQAALHARLRLWPPGKTGFVLHQHGRYLAGSATPRLRVLSEMPLRALFEWQRLRLMRRAAAAGYRLDARAANFGRLPGGLSLYYLDDEIYPLSQ